MLPRPLLLVGLALLLGLPAPVTAGQAPPAILALGSTGFLNPGPLQAALGVEIAPGLGQRKLTEFAVVVLANISLAALPAPVQAGLEAYVGEGGALLLTGGSQAFGSGGYQAISSLVPFLIRSDSDWRSTPFRPPVALQPGHPILAGVTFVTVGNLNDLNPRPGASEILQAAGGRAAFASPLIAEQASGAGRVLGIAFDLTEFAGMRDRDRFVQNTLAYLLTASRIPPPTR